MLSLLELESMVNFDRDGIGAALTEDTLRDIRENQFNGEVCPVGVIFRHEFADDQANSLIQLPRPSDNRKAAYGLLEYVAAERQKGVRELLFDPGRTNQYFEHCRAVRFEPQRHVVVLPALNMIVTLATDRLVERLWEDPSVLAVLRDMPAFDVHDDEVCLLGQSVHGTLGKNSGHRDSYTWGWHRLRLPEIHREGHRGADVRLGIADAFVSDYHADLSAKIVDFMQIQPPGIAQPAHSLDPKGHGTHMAGIMVGGDFSGVQIGGAPDAKLVACCAVHDRGSLLSALAGIDWLVNPTRCARVVNLSFGVHKPNQQEEQMLETLIRRSMLLDVVFVAAIGNDARKSRWPARAPSVLAVGALDADETVWANSGDNPDLVAPGVEIFSCIPSGLRGFHGQSYCLKTGTSPATAHVSALVGLLMHAVDQASADLVMEALKRTASHANKPDKRFGYGVPDYFAAREYARRQLAN